MTSATHRRTVLHQFLRECTEWDAALHAVMDSIHHRIPLVPETVGKTLTVLHHHSQSVDPAVRLMAYYNKFVDVTRRRVLPSGYEDMKSNAEIFLRANRNDENFLDPYNQFYRLCCARRMGWDAALALLPSGHHIEEMPVDRNFFGDINVGDRTFLNDESLQLLVDLCRQCGQWQHGCSLFRRMKQPNAKCSSDLLAAVLHACAIGRQWNEALMLFGHYAKTEMTIDAVAYDRIVHACYRASQYTHATRILQEILSIGMVPHENTVRMCLHAVEETGDWSSALYLLRGLQENNLQVTSLMHEEAIRAVLCNSYFSKHYTDDAWHIALGLIQELKQRYKTRPSPYFQELLFASWIRRRQTSAESAYAVFKEAEKRHAVKANSRVLFDVMLEKTFLEKKWGIFFAMKHRLNDAFREKNALEANLIISATALVGHWWGAIAVWLKNKQRGMETVCLETKGLLLTCAGKINNPSLAQAVRHELLQGGDDVAMKQSEPNHDEQHLAGVDRLIQNALRTGKFQPSNEPNWLDVPPA